MQPTIIEGHVDLDMGEWAVAESSDILETGGASTCGIVAVLNHSQGRAWMVHQATPYMIIADTKEMLADASSQKRLDDDVEIWLAGCGPGPTQACDQQALFKALTTYLPNIVQKIHWGQEGLTLEFSAITRTWTALFR
jgi:hypothetical protein